MIQAKNLKKTFDGPSGHRTEVLRGLNLTVDRGSIYGLIGRNGTGKTTLIHLLSGVYRPDSGQITFDGAPVWENPAVKCRMAVLPDHPVFAAGESLCSAGKRCRRLYPRWDQNLFETAISSLGLEPKKSLRSFSKGMKKQAALALALAARPALLMLDEPMDGLDPVVRKTVRHLILDQVSQQQTAVLIASHNLRELEGICDHIGLIRGGVMAAESDLDDLKGSVCKVRTVFRGGLPADLAGQLSILHRESLGAMETLIVKGCPDAVKACLLEASPLILELLPLTLEEIFIYALGGDQDETES